MMTTKNYIKGDLAAYVRLQKSAIVVRMMLSATHRKGKSNVSHKLEEVSEAERESR